ncbi:MAG: hypothetical protein DLM62_13760 [Pseudonocardiales bacterium]|nr:MAG: hypothetical protein DLM62_13760 [Pseudonocardiales bacterium]
MVPGVRPRRRRTIVGFGFTTLGRHRISAAIGPGNTASVAVAIVTRLGSSGKARLRDHVFTNGARRDSILYSLLTPNGNHPRPPANDAF